MSDIPSSAQYVQIEGAELRAPVSESLVQTIGGSTNYLLDQNTTNTAAIASNTAAIAAINATLKLQVARGISASIAAGATTTIYAQPGTHSLENAFLTLDIGGGLSGNFTVGVIAGGGTLRFDYGTVAGLAYIADVHISAENLIVHNVGTGVLLFQWTAYYYG